MTHHEPPPAGPVRVEHDSLGDRDVPAEAYWGISTLRAVENFPVSGRTIGSLRSLLWGFGAIKSAAARSNEKLGFLDPERSAAIQAAAREVMDGLLDEHFVVDRIQGGAGTSTNMNANEVIANRALELLGHTKGDYAFLHPIDDVNRSQSTNDTYPTAIKVALQRELALLCAEHEQLSNAFAAKATEFAGIVKVGRTQLQDAVPMTLGQEFGAFAETLSEDRNRLLELLPHLRESNLGATAIGTGITAPPGYRSLVIEELNALTGLQLVSAANLVEATSDTGVFLLVSGVLKRAAVKLSKICNDLRLLSSGPQTGFGEIFLPAVQAGSSIMPGKVNPVIPEMVNQVAFRVVGTDATVTMAVEAGQLQLNAFEPVVADALFESLSWLTSACRQLRTHCIEGITANTAVLQQRILESVSVVTGLAPIIGYAAAAELAKEALASKRTVAGLATERGLLDEQILNQALSPSSLAGLG
ncbi:MULTISPECIES: aspartate ammonia-lyase [Arthrobacter]|uniref:Aspartate ammonia-lyase n=1 Tax=Arthrobacter terricola TaxID=2547396 RepID=A0A4R5K9J8_9MICC|nr:MULTISPECIES: aspartate ammonia-lyase [Arthrobacter]MBT8162225.1 aspartate ammonia-lyase [Arthrobacter sp. GN70]TDF89162.1 aspartate ammonia-lyase [Arthrobacter terricola]